MLFWVLIKSLLKNVLLRWFMRLQVQKVDCVFVLRVPAIRQSWKLFLGSSVKWQQLWLTIWIKICRGCLLGHSVVSYDSERCLLQDEDHFWGRPPSFPGLCHMRFGTSPECFRSDPDWAVLWESRQDWIARLKCDFPSY